MVKKPSQFFDSTYYSKIDLDRMQGKRDPGIEERHIIEGVKDYNNDGKNDIFAYSYDFPGIIVVLKL